MSSVEISKQDSVLTVRMCEPARRNALSKGIREGLWEGIHRARDDRNIRALVLEGDGPAFCAGGDLADMPDDHLRGIAFVTEIWELFGGLEKLPVPVVAAVTGPATGGGLELCLASDFVVAGRTTARFALPEVKVGLVPAFAVGRLPQIVGLRRARQLAMGGAFLSATDALDWGLVTTVVDDDQVRAHAQELARQLSTSSPIGVGLTKRIMNRDLGGIEQSFAIEACAMLFTDRDTREGIDAFLNKRETNFVGRDR